MLVSKVSFGDGKCSRWLNWNTITQPKSHGGLGIRPTHDANVALLGKHVWDIMHSTRKLWVQLLSATYLQGNHILRANSTEGGSYTWSSTFKAAQILKPTFCIRLRKGEVSFWYDKWLEDLSLQFGSLCEYSGYLSSGQGCFS